MTCGIPLEAPAPASRFASPASYTPKHLAERILTSKSALEGERKHVTVLFADVKGWIPGRASGSCGGVMKMIFGD